MSKNILIIESDTALSATLRQALEDRGFSVQETADGKSSVEQIRRDRPDLVVLAVDLSAGQNGYLICGKLKKDDDLKNVPIVITGNPDGFAQHRKLKAHADDYVAKPVDPQQLVEAVGRLIGFPELLTGEVIDEPLGFGGFGEDETVAGGEELPLEGLELAPQEEGLDFDSSFSDLTNDLTSESTAMELEQPVEPPPEPQAPLEDDFTGLESLGGESEDPLDALGSMGDSDRTVVGYSAMQPAAPPAPVARPVVPAATRPASAPVPTAVRPAPAHTAAASGLSAADAAELRSLRARAAELQSALEEAESQGASAQSRVQELEAELEARSTELEAARASANKGDKDTFALRDAVNRKDKELLRLRSELNQKDQEIVEIKERQLELEQQAGSSSGEIARRDAQLKTLTAKVEQLTADRKRMEQQLTSAREEARNVNAQLTALQAELGNAQHLQAEMEETRLRAEQLDAELQAVRGESETLRAQFEQVQAERLEEGERTQRLDEEVETLRRRVAELEEAAARNEDRVGRLYARVKGDEKLRERARKALAIAAQLLEEQPTGQDEEAAA